MAKRFNAYSKSIYDFITDIFVICPGCGKQGIVLTKGYSYKKDLENEIKFSCTYCGENKMYAETPKKKFDGKGKKVNSRVYKMGTDVDPFFHFPLWLRMEHGDKIFWAYNYEHLDLIQKHVEADLRVRDSGGNYHLSIGHKLPRWITAKKNREDVLKIIEKLRKK